MNKLGIAASSLFTAFTLNTAKAQFADIPEFSLKYEVDAGIVGTDEEIFWTSKKLPNGIQELHGHVDLEAGFLFLGADFYLGLITEIDRKNQTIKNTIYDDENSDKCTISEYDKQIIKKYDLNPEKVKNVTSELFDYKNRTVTDLETRIERPLYDNEMGFQEGFFILANAVNKDTTLIINYRGQHHPINVDKFHDYDEQKDGLYIDMTIPDAKNPGSRKNIIGGIDYLKLYMGNGFPEKISTTINILFGIGVDVNRIK